MSVTLVLGELRQTATLTGPVATGSPPVVAVPDGDGGYTYTYGALTPAQWRCSIEKATVKNSERLFASTVIAHATHILTGRFHPQINTKTKIVWVDRAGTTHTANVLDTDDSEGAGVELVVLVSEIVP